MADQNQILKIVLQLQADVAAGRDATKAALQEVQAQAVETARVVNSVGQTTVAVNPNNAAYIAQSEARLATMMASQEKSAVNEALINAQMERRVIIETQLEAAEARIAGNGALAVRLEREAEIRTRALTIQRTLNITTEESIALAERMVIAQEASAVASNAMGINLAKAKTEAIVLGRELATGTVRASTMSSLLGSLGTTFTIAGIAAYELYHIIGQVRAEALEVVKANGRMATEIHDAIIEWDTMATRAQSFADQVKLADKVKVELAKVSKELAEFRARELSSFAKFWDAIVTLGGKELESGKAAVGPNQRELDQQKADAEERYKLALRDANIEIDRAKEKTQEWAAAEADLPLGLDTFSKKLSEAEAKLARLDAARQANREDPKALQAYIDQLSVVEDLRNKVNQLGDELDKNNKKVAAGSGPQREINALVREQRNLLAEIHGQQQIINQNPFLSDDQKNKLLFPLIRQEMVALGDQLRRDQAEQAKLTDPAQWNRMEGAIIQAKVRLAELGQTAQKTTFLGGIRAELTAWVNSFGTTSKQIAGIITGTLNTAINATSQALTNAIFKTGSWKQAFASAAQSIVQNIIQILLQWIVNQTIMKGLSAVFKQADAATTAAAAAKSAAAWAGPATAASIATEGAADVTGVAALTVAMAAGKSIVVGSSVGGYATGGFTGGREGAIAGVVHGKEYVFSAPATARLGVSFLDSLHSNVSRPGYERGGYVSAAGSPSGAGASSAPAREQPIHIFNFTDEKRLAKAIMDTPQGRKIIVDTITSRKIDLGF